MLRDPTWIRKSTTAPRSRSATARAGCVPWPTRICSSRRCGATSSATGRPGPWPPHSRRASAAACPQGADTRGAPRVGDRRRQPANHCPPPPHRTGIARGSATHRSRCVRSAAGLSEDSARGAEQKEEVVAEERDNCRRAASPSRTPDLLRASVRSPACAVAQALRPCCTINALCVDCEPALGRPDETLTDEGRRGVANSQQTD